MKDKCDKYVMESFQILLLEIRLFLFYAHICYVIV